MLPSAADASTRCRAPERMSAPSPAADDRLSLAALNAIQTALYAAVGKDPAWQDALHVLAQAFDASFAMLVAAGQGQRDQSFYAA